MESQKKGCAGAKAATQPGGRRARQARRSGGQRSKGQERKPGKEGKRRGQPSQAKATSTTPRQNDEAKTPTQQRKHEQAKQNRAEDDQETATQQHLQKQDSDRHARQPGNAAKGECPQPDQSPHYVRVVQRRLSAATRGSSATPDGKERALQWTSWLAGNPCFSPFLLSDSLSLACFLFSMLFLNYQI